MKADEDYYDSFFEEIFPWREFSPEEFAARHWLEFGACTLAQNNIFRDPEMRKWAVRFEEILHNPELIEECRQTFLTDLERADQDETLKRIDENGFQP